MGIIINQYKDPYYTTSIMETKRVFFVAHLYRLIFERDCLYTHPWSIWGGIGNTLEKLDFEYGKLLLNFFECEKFQETPPYGRFRMLIMTLKFFSNWLPPFSGLKPIVGLPVAASCKCQLHV